MVRLGGAGRGFSSGAGISADDVSDGGGVPPDEIILEINRLVRAITALPRPVVAVVQGPAAGVGVSIALACDVVLASDKAFFMLAFTKIGLMPDGGASALVAAAIGRIRAMRMALLPERLAGRRGPVLGPGQRGLPGRRLRRRGGQGDRPGCWPAPRWRSPRPSMAINAATLTELDPALQREFDGQSVPAEVARLRRGRKGFPGTPRPQLHRFLKVRRFKARRNG